MGLFTKGVDRCLVTLFPDRLEDWIDEDNPVRVIDVFLEELCRCGPYRPVRPIGYPEWLSAFPVFRDPGK